MGNAFADLLQVLDPSITRADVGELRDESWRAVLVVRLRARQGRQGRFGCQTYPAVDHIGERL